MATDFAALRLRANGDPARLNEILQMECREKNAAKLRDTLAAAPGFRFPSLAVAEMATSDAVADFHASLIEPGERVADLTLGLGIDSFALARKAASVEAVDINPANVEAARANASLLGLGNISLTTADSAAWIADCPHTFDTLFIDPARRDSAGRHICLADCSPDVTAMLPLMRSKCRRVVIKMSPMLDISAALAALALTSDQCEVIAIGIRSECKELLFVIPGLLPGSPRPSGLIRAVTLGHSEFSYRASDPIIIIPDGQPCRDWIIAEPFPAVMKTGGYRYLGRDYPDIARSSHDTHLYYSAFPIPDFPGRLMRIIDIVPFSSSECRRFASKYPKINITTRNFPLTAPQLAAKLKVTQGGDLTLFALTDSTARRMLIIARP